MTDVDYGGGLVHTSAGMCGLWRPEAFTSLTDYDLWEAEFEDEAKLRGHISNGSFVPVNVGGDGAFEVVARSGGLTEREARVLVVSSEPYLLISQGAVYVGGIEDVGPDAIDSILLEVPPGRYSVTIHLLDWKKEEGAVLADGEPADDALSDFVIEFQEERRGQAHRVAIETFERS